MSLPDYRAPSYSTIFEARAAKLVWLQEDPVERFPAARRYYKHAPWDFIRDWGEAYEPRNQQRGQIARIPLVPWPKQVEYLQWLMERWRSGERGLVEKSRDCGVTWLSVAFSVSLWLFYSGVSVGFGSRKEELVDTMGDPDSIFEKLRLFILALPKDFQPLGFDHTKHFAHRRILNPENGASITGEGGDNIGRGGRKSIYFVDEAAFIERQDTVDRALSQNTDCQIDISTPNGSGNAFYKKRMKFASERVFIFDWKDDPRKDAEWYKRQCEEQDEVTVAQEIDRDYAASSEDSFIPAKWVVAAVDAHKTLGFGPQGLRVTGFDPADVGDAKGLVNRWGSVVLEADQLTQGDITQALPWAFEAADTFRADVLAYDGDGMGAPVMKTRLDTMAAQRMRVAAYHGSAGVLDPKRLYDGQKTRKKRAKELESLHDGLRLRSNADSFQNYRAQTWSWLRDRFRSTHEAVTKAGEGHVVNADPDDLISIDSGCKRLLELQSELSRPKRLWTPNGKIKVEAKADMKKRGVDSPNLADALVIAMSIRAQEQQARPLRRIHHQRMKDRAVGY